MPRRGWLPAPDGWVQIICGPHPPSAKRPKASVQVTNAQQGDVGGPRSQVRGRLRQQPGRVSAEVSFEAAQRRVAQIEGALRAFGDATGPEVKMLQDSLKAAKRAGQVLPVTVQITQCEQFIARPRNGWQPTTRSESCW